MFTDPLFEIKPHLLSTVLFSGFESFHKLWNPLIKAVYGKFHSSGGHDNGNCLQHLLNFHSFQAWEIVPIFNILDILGIPHEIALRWKLQDLTNDKSSLDQVMVWCCQATSHGPEPNVDQVLQWYVIFFTSLIFTSQIVFYFGKYILPYM